MYVILLCMRIFPNVHGLRDLTSGNRYNAVDSAILRLVMSIMWVERPSILPLVCLWPSLFVVPIEQECRRVEPPCYVVACRALWKRSTHDSFIRDCVPDFFWGCGTDISISRFAEILSSTVNCDERRHRRREFFKIANHDENDDTKSPHSEQCFC